MPKCPIAEEHRKLARAHPADQAIAHLADLCLYHWSPRTRRASIQRLGFVPGSRSLQGDWRPPYICFSDNPDLAWSLSGAIHPEVEEWDLWMVYPGHGVEEWELIFDTYVGSGRHYIKEYRVYQPVAKRHIVYLASRSKSSEPTRRRPKAVVSPPERSNDGDSHTGA